MNKKKIIFLLVLIFIISFCLTIVLVNKNKSTEEITQQEETVTPQISEKVEDECTQEYITTVSQEEKLSAAAILILKKYYTGCEHTINEYVELPKELVNMTKEEVEAKYKDWQVIGFEKGKVTLYKEFDGQCGEHFILKIENGKIVIYINNPDGTQSLYEKTNISSEYLTETDLLNMQDGLEIYGKEELNKIIEDFE